MGEKRSVKSRRPRKHSANRHSSVDGLLAGLEELLGMTAWGRFLDSLDSGGGHIVILLLIMSGGVALEIKTGLEMEAREIIAGAFGALMYSMKNGHRNGVKL